MSSLNVSSKAASSLLVPSKATRHQLNQDPQHGHRVDPSVLRPAINVSVTGMKQAVQVMENGSQEIRNYLLNECNLIYECRTCFNMFRSVANLVAHKRSFCKERLQDVRHVYRRDPGEYLQVEEEEEEEELITTAFVQPEDVIDTVIKDKELDLTGYSPSLEVLKEAGFIKEVENRALFKQLKPERKPGLNTIVERLKERLICGPEYDYYRGKEQHHLIRLEKLKQNSNARFQTIGHQSSTMGDRYLELERLKKRPSVFLGPDGRIIDPGPPPGAEKSSHFDLDGSFKENIQLTKFPCPICKKIFSDIRNVYRHCIRLHKKSPEEGQRLKKKSRHLALMAASSKKLAKARKKSSDQDNIAVVTQEIKTVSPKTSNSPYWCTKCFKTFASSQGRASHMNHCKASPKEIKSTVIQPIIQLEKLAPTLEHNLLKRYRNKYKNPVNSIEVTREDIDDDDDPEISFNRNQEDKDSGIGNGNNSEESNDEEEEVAKKRRTKSETNKVGKPVSILNSPTKMMRKSSFTSSPIAKTNRSKK